MRWFILTIATFACTPPPVVVFDGGGGGAGGSATAGGSASAGGTGTAGGSVGSYDGGTDPSCTVPGCLRAITKIGDYTVADLLPFIAPGATLDNGYSVYTLELFSDGVPTKATVTIPFAATAPTTGWHIVANNHGTTGLGDACAVAGTVAGAGLAGLFGAHGLIGVAPDYPGLGEPGVHPYLVKKSEGRASLDALRATRWLARQLAVPLSGRFAVAGLSQGGHATLAAAAEHMGYAPELDIRGFAASGPASMWEEQWRLGVSVDGAHIPLHAMLIYSWSKHYAYSGPTVWTPATAAKIDMVMNDSCAASVPSIGDQLGSSAAGIFDSAFLSAYRTASWGPYFVFHDAFTQNRIGPWAQSAPLKIYQGTADDTVPEWATTAMVAGLRDGGVTVDYELVPDGGHVDVAFGFVAYPQLRTTQSIAWLKARLDAP